MGSCISCLTPSIEEFQFEMIDYSNTQISNSNPTKRFCQNDKINISKGNKFNCDKKAYGQMKYYIV
jgi:hypothetical protein